MKRKFRKALIILRYYSCLRLFRRLFWFYSRKGLNAEAAVSNAELAFSWLTGYNYKKIIEDGPAYWMDAQDVLIHERDRH